MKQTLKKAFRIVSDVLLFLFVAVCAFCVVLTVSSKRNEDDSAQFLGYRLLFVQSASMERCEETWEEVQKYRVKDLPTGTCIFVQTVPEDAKEKEAWIRSLQVGDVVTFRYVVGQQETITHRIVSLREDGAHYYVSLQGDNRTEGTTQQVFDAFAEDSPNYIVGKVIGQSLFLGRMISSLKTPAGIALIVLLPCLLIISLEVSRIVGALKESGKRESAEQLEKTKEIEQLKEHLAALQQEVLEKQNSGKR